MQSVQFFVCFVSDSKASLFLAPLPFLVYLYQTQLAASFHFINAELKITLLLGHKALGVDIFLAERNVSLL